MKKIIMLWAFFMSMSFGVAHAQVSGSTTATSKATATLAAICTLSSQNVSFGQISLPVSTQSATSSINVQCTKGSSYTIGLAYGGIYAGQTVTQAIIGTQHIPPQCSNCIYNVIGTYTNGVLTSTDTECACYMTGWKPTTTTTYYNYGKMSGVSQGDAIAYAIQVPNNPSQVWNTGNYTYTASGIGSNQSIPVVATLVPGQTTDKYPAADSYVDVVTATVTY
jgi:spore coat protein U-like protein